MSEWEGSSRGKEGRGRKQENMVKILGKDILGEEYMKKLEGARGGNEEEWKDGWFKESTCRCPKMR